MSQSGSSDSSWSETSTGKINGPNQQSFRTTGTYMPNAVGNSVSDALMALQPPPPDAKPGSKDAPWLRLTDWEMMNLRRRMKKNTKWRPSESMVKVELINSGRGPHNYWEAKKEAEARGVEFLDVDNIAAADPNKPRAWGEVGLTAPSSSEDIPRNKGMALNEAKKRKRDEILASSSQRTSKDIGDDGLPSQKRASLNAPLPTESAFGLNTKRKTTSVYSHDGPKMTSKDLATQDSAETNDSIETSTEGIQAGEGVVSMGSFASHVLINGPSVTTSEERPKQKSHVDPIVGPSTRLYAQNGEERLSRLDSHESHIGRKAHTMPDLGIQKQVDVVIAPYNSIRKGTFPTDTIPGAETGSTQNTNPSPVALEPEVSQQSTIDSELSVTVEASLSQLSNKRPSPAFSDIRNTIGPNPSTSRPETPLLHRPYNPHSTAFSTKRSTASPPNQTVSSAAPPQHPSYNHPFTAASHTERAFGAHQSNNTSSTARSHSHITASPHPSTSMSETPLTQQPYNSPSTARSQQLNKESRVQQNPRVKPRFDHRESLSKIVGRKPPVLKATHRPAQPPPIVQPPPTIKASSMTKPYSATKSSPAAKPSTATKSPSVAKPSSKSKAQSAGDKPAPKRKYIPGGPGGGGRYVDL